MGLWKSKSMSMQAMRVIAFGFTAFAAIMIYSADGDPNISYNSPPIIEYSYLDNLTTDNEARIKSIESHVLEKVMPIFPSVGEEDIEACIDSHSSKFCIPAASIKAIEDVAKTIEKAISEITVRTNSGVNSKPVENSDNSKPISKNNSSKTVEKIDRVALEGAAKEVQDSMLRFSSGLARERHPVRMVSGKWGTATLVIKPLGEAFASDGKLWPVVNCGEEVIRIYQSMAARIEASDFEVRPNESKRYTIDINQGVSWSWEIRPLKSGALNVRYVVEGKPIIPTLTIDDTPVIYSEPWTVFVESAPLAERMKDFLAENWQYVAGGFGALAMAFVTAFLGKVFQKKS